MTSVPPRMMFLFMVVLLTSSVIQVASTFLEQDLVSAIDTSLHLGQEEHNRQRAFNEHLLAVGIDTVAGSTRSTGKATCMRQLSQMFCHMNNQSFAQADQAFVGLQATKVLSQKLGLPLVALQENPLISQIWPQLFGRICSPRKPSCPPVTMHIRTADGSCNNLKHPTWGMSNRPQGRYLPPVYDDGLSTSKTRSVTGKALPGSRLVSNVLHEPIVDDLFENTQTVVVMQFGQMLDHDMIDTPMSKGANRADIECCKISPHMASKRAACFPIPIPENDQRFKTPCMNFVRSTAGTHDDCRIDYRNQINQLTSYVDISFLYGSTENEMNSLRTFYGGKLIMDKRGLFGEDPNASPGLCIKEHPGDYCMKTGDRKIHVVPTLTALEVIYLREHNRMAKKLSHLNPHWNDEMLFQTIRKIMIAIFAHTVYDEYLPIILGPAVMKQFQLHSQPHGYDTRYNPTIDATISNVFGVAAFRFGHSTVPGFIALLTKIGKRSQTDLENTYNKPFTAMINNGEGVDKINRWQVSEPTAKMDRFLEKGLRDELFLDDDGDAFDLAALNTQRGRDHGIPGYNAWRRFCGLPTASNFGTKVGGLVDVDPESALRLSTIYKHPDDMDLYSAGLTEMLLAGASVGPVFACIIGKQFNNLKYGDRFWYENNSPGIAFTEAQLHSIKKVPFSRLTCNSLNDAFIQADAFHIPSPSNPTVPCDQLPDINLHLWKDQSFVGLMPPFYPTANLLPIHIQGPHYIVDEQGPHVPPPSFIPGHKFSVPEPVYTVLHK